MIRVKHALAGDRNGRRIPLHDSQRNPIRNFCCHLENDNHYASEIIQEQKIQCVDEIRGLMLQPIVCLGRKLAAKPKATEW